MKKLSLVFVLFVALAATSCSSDDDNNPIVYPTVASEPFLRFTASGFNYNYDNVETLSSLQTLIFAFEGTGNDHRRVSLWMPNGVTVGTHQITLAPPSDLEAYTASYTVGDETLDATSGTLNVTSITADYIEGTFTFTAVDQTATTTIVVSEGSFKSYAPSN